MKKTVLFIDAGHGGYTNETGYQTFPTDGKLTLHNNGKDYHDESWFYEGHFNRIFADEFIEEAMKEGFICIPVYRPLSDTWRYNDYSQPGKPVQEGSRCNLANTIWEMMGRPNALCLSFHANSNTKGTTPQTAAGGPCAMVYKLGSETAKLADTMIRPVHELFKAKGSKLRSQLVHDNSLDMTTWTKMPCILFELGFFDNPQNADLLMIRNFRVEMAKILAKKAAENLQ
jgi:N-acetylmuramoyl-L-alanine amidase